MNNCLVFDKRLDTADLNPRSLLCVGGTRSGKSDFALQYAQNIQGPKTFIATMQKNFANQQKEITDKELQKRILNHQKQRNSTWTTIEEPYDLISAANLAKRNDSKIILIDCISLWLSNLLLANETEETVLKKINDVAKMINDTQIPLVLVSNEVGMGIVPLYEEARIFRDIQGKANQIFAEACEAVITFSCGIPILIKG
ncbi:MAG: bifunctional adenosylcobinamide kinase/adenosylcobinamide-phosphate guanylyltransferase [Mailhella sp.]|nr:bifunctional adenosylcobinamide kinase/adenosylcobinamide-phosphate guanylyltransferase [Mailhella sp.]